MKRTRQFHSVAPGTNGFWDVENELAVCDADQRQAEGTPTWARQLGRSGGWAFSQILVVDSTNLFGPSRFDLSTVELGPILSVAPVGN
ncbi:MAG: hypothetical protein ACE361_07470 [Aureliella sp.]